MFVEIPFEQLIRSALLAVLAVYLFRHGRYSKLLRRRGGAAILIGVLLVLLGALMETVLFIRNIDAYFNPAHIRFVEDFIGYTLGVLFFVYGLVQLFPAIVQLEATENSLRESEARFREIFEASPDPVVLARLDSGAVIDVNQACAEVTGVTREQAIGKNSAELNLWADPSMRDLFRDALLRDGEVNNMEVEFNLVGGIDWGLLSARVIIIGGEKCILIMVRDISAAKQAELALRDMNRVRNEFISTAAHELLTPLSVLLGYAELLHEKPFPEEVIAQHRDDALEVILRKGRDLSRIVDDLLDISRFEQGQTLRIDLAEFDPADLLQRMVRNFQVHAPRHSFDLSLVEQDQRLLHADEHRLVQVMENLLSNAVKYSPVGSTIRVREERTAEFHNIHVEDDGIGMTPEQLERVFDKFYRVDASNTAVSGLGLGMSVVRQVVEAHGGNITLQSEPEQGTRVTVVLPWTPSHRIGGQKTV